jgi:hypothetical protein
MRPRVSSRSAGRTLAAIFVLAIGAAPTACSLDPAGAEASDAGSDATRIPEAAQVPDLGAAADTGRPCPGLQVSCNGACVSFCNGCSAGSALCPATGVCGHCDACPGATLECFVCGADGSLPGAYCSSVADQCNAHIGGTRCTCTFGMPTQCPGQSQICSMQGECLACGADGTIGITCANGQICVMGPTGPSCSGT